MQLIDEHGVDVLQGLGMDCDRANTTNAPIVYSGTSVHPAVLEDSVLRLKIGDQLVASAQLTITLYYATGY